MEIREIRGKSVTTSVPSMSIRFNASNEEIEEIYASEDEQNDQLGSEITRQATPDLESSPRRSLLPLLGKRSTSVDTIGSAQDASPPSDPWRFLSDIKGKITKSVEGKLTEYKSRTQDGDGSPKIIKPIKDSKESSSLSDSEEASESSISRTCGIVSTTEGVEMSSDDETPSLSDKEKPADTRQPINEDSGVRQRFRITDNKTATKEGTVGKEFLQNIQIANDDLTSQDSTEIESGIDALAELNISNFQVDSDNVLNISQVTGSEIRNAEFSGKVKKHVTFSPIGFVDLRPPQKKKTWFNVLYDLKGLLVWAVGLTLYFVLPLTVYQCGFITGALMMLTVTCLYVKLFYDKETFNLNTSSFSSNDSLPILEIPAAKEYQPLKKYEGWMNEYPEEYNPHTYHVTQTQSVYLKLQGNFLKVSHTKQKIPKRAMWNEPEHKLNFTSHRIYNLIGAKVVLLPIGLAKVRHWSKKYPIAISLNKDQMNFEYPAGKKGERMRRENEKMERRKGETSIEMQIFSKLSEEISEEPSTQNVENEDIVETDECLDIQNIDDLNPDDEDSICNIQDWSYFAADDSPDETNLYLFGRTGREKEDWFRRFKAATHKITDPVEASDDDTRSSTPEPISGESLDNQYLIYMIKMHKLLFNGDDSSSRKNLQNFLQLQNNLEEETPADNSEEDLKTENIIWINSLMARVLFDCLREQSVIQRIKERIQRKLASIRLPYFIEELICEELNLGTTSPIIHKATKPVLNDRGLWIDLDITYEGLVVVILQTKLNLLKLKQPPGAEEKPIAEKSAMFHSDVDDTAESTSDDEPVRCVAHTSSVLDAKGLPVPGLGGVSNKSKKLMKMVDRIAESKFFQVATENKYIKKAMQGVSNTDLRLKVEVKKCKGTLTINIPPPPSDRLWLGFRVPPELLISAHPIVGERNINFMRVTSWIEKKIYKEFQKVFVIPNMEDLSIPVMSPQLPN